MADCRCAEFSGKKIYRGWTAVSAQPALAAERAENPAFESALASAFIFVIAADAERDAARHDAGRLFAFGAIVRSGGLRSGDRLGFLARTRRISRARETNFAGDVRG